MNSASILSAILLYDVQGQDHVMDPFNLKSETIGRPLKFAGFSNQFPSTNYGYIKHLNTQAFTYVRNKLLIATCTRIGF